MENNIVWTEQNEFFGLDYSTKEGKFLDYSFDIRYDYCGPEKVRPTNCGAALCIYFKGARIYSTLGSIQDLTDISERYLRIEYEKYKYINI